MLVSLVRRAAFKARLVTWLQDPVPWLALIPGANWWFLYSRPGHKVLIDKEGDMVVRPSSLETKLHPFRGCEWQHMDSSSGCCVMDCKLIGSETTTVQAKSTTAMAVLALLWLCVVAVDKSVSASISQRVDCLNGLVSVLHSIDHVQVGG